MTQSTAVTSQGTLVKIATGSGGAKTVTGVAVGVVTILTSNAHGFVAGDYITFDSNFAGANAATLNGKSYTVIYKTTNTYAIAEDTTGLTITAGTAAATPTTFTAIANIKSFSGFDGSSSEVDKTHMASTGKEYLLGLVDYGNISLEIDVDNGDAGQLACRDRHADGAVKAFQIILPAGTNPTASFNAYVKKFSTNAGVDSVVKGTIDLRITGAVTWA